MNIVNCAYTDWSCHSEFHVKWNVQLTTTDLWKQYGNSNLLVKYSVQGIHYRASHHQTCRSLPSKDNHLCLEILPVVCTCVSVTCTKHSAICKHMQALFLKSVPFFDVDDCGHEEQFPPGIQYWSSTQVYHKYQKYCPHPTKIDECVLE